MTRKLLSIVAIVALTSCSLVKKEKQPSKDEIEQSFALRLPSFAAASVFSIEAMQNMGTQVDPAWVTRFRATVKLKANTFTSDGEDATVVYIRPIKRSGETSEIFGKSISRLYMGTWRTTFEYEGQPIATLGLPESAFGPKKVIARGSKEEREYQAEKADAEQREIAALPGL